MKEIAIILRALQLFAHNAHNMAKGSTFLEDHEFLGELYPEYEEAYDAIVERMIGEGDKTDLNGMTKFAYELSFAGKYNSNEESFATILAQEKALCKAISKAMKGASDGTQNLLQGLADESESRQYKLQQRLAK